MVYRDVCQNCNTGSAFEESDDRIVWPEYTYSTTGVDAKVDHCVGIRVRTCTHCAKSSAWLERFDRSDPGRYFKRTSAQLIIPSATPRELEPTVPEDIRSLFAEASICETIGALRGAAGLYRATAEALCRDQQAEGATLAAKLASLKKSKEIAEQILEDLHEARLLGNYSLHDGLEFTSEEVADVADLLEEATVALYVQPAERRRLREARRLRREAGRGAADTTGSST